LVSCSTTMLAVWVSVRIGGRCSETEVMSTSHTG